MAKQIHTHRGHCQLCSSVQAIDTHTGIIAEHGYTVRGGYFNGSCPGSKTMNLHVSRNLADSHIKFARAEAMEKRAYADELEERTVDPTYSWNGEYHLARDDNRQSEILDRASRAPYCPVTRVETHVKWDLAPATFQDICRTREIDRARIRASTCENYAKGLEYWANRITGKVEPYQVKDLEPREHAIGDTVTIGGKKGWTAIIEAIEDQEYRTFGFRRGHGTVMCKHARLTRPAIPEKKNKEGWVTQQGYPAKTHWAALRDIKRAPNPLAEELKKAGLL